MNVVFVSKTMRFYGGGEGTHETHEVKMFENTELLAVYE